MDEKTHHLGITKEFAENISTWLLSGEPARTDAAYGMLDVQGERIVTGRQLPIAKGYLIRIIEGKEHSIPVGLATSGMGLGSTEITAMELVETFIKTGQEPSTIIRIGTAGSHQPDVHGGDLVIANKTYTIIGAVDDLIETKHERATYHRSMAYLLERVEELTKKLAAGQNKETADYLERVKYDLAASEIIETPSCNPQVIAYIQQAAKYLKLECRTGSVFSKQTLFSEASGTFVLDAEGKRKNRLEMRQKVMHNLGICASEMEVAMLTAIARLANLKGHDIRIGGIMAVVNNPLDPSKCVNPLFANDEVVQSTVKKALNLGLEAVVEIYKAERMYQK